MKPSKTDFFLAGGWTKLVVTLTEKNPAAPEVCIAAVSLEETRTPVRKERKRTGRVCPACGYRWQDIRRYRFLGCPDCYQHFSPFLSQEKARGQFWWQHRGKIPETLKKKMENNLPRVSLSPADRRRLARLKKLLDESAKATFPLRKTS